MRLKLYGLLFVAFFATLTVFDGFFITQEGTVTVVKSMGKADREVEPGFHFKLPFVESTVDLDIRERKSGGKMQVSTSEQMPADAVITANWSIKKGAGLNLFKDYGSLEQFEDKVLEPKLLEAAKQGTAGYTAEEQMTKRDKVTESIRQAFVQKVSYLPIDVSAVQIEDLEFPKDYLASIANKQTQKNNADAEKFVLEKQNLTARQRENTAQAEANSTLMVAKAEAESIELKGKAEAMAIEAKAKALQGNPLIIELEKVKNWNGSYVTTNIGSGATPFVDLREKK